MYEKLKTNNGSILFLPNYIMALIHGHLLRVYGKMYMISKQNHFKPGEIFDGLKALTEPVHRDAWSAVERFARNVR